MKSFFTLLILLIPFVGFGQKTYVPNDIFEMYLETNGMGDGFINNDSVLTENILSINELNLSGYGITDFTGLEDFISLEYFNCNNNGYNGMLDLSANLYLKELICSNQGVNELILTNNDSLEKIVCYDNSLSELNLENNINLKYIDCEDNNISSLNLTNCTALEYLYCNDNDLSTLNINGLYELEDGQIQNNVGLYCIEVDSPIFFENILQYNFFTFFSSDCENLIYGCMDEQSCNFNEYATVNDGLCFYDYNDTINIIECDSFVWNDNTYYQSGTYETVFTSVFGCDSVEYLDITIFNTIQDNQINGEANPQANSIHFYSTENSSNDFNWEIDGGVIIENYGNEVLIQWNAVENGSISMIESNYCNQVESFFYVSITQFNLTYNCIDGNCIEVNDGSGTYTSIEGCEANCNPIVDSWNCVNDACVDQLDGSGEFSTLNDCEQVCQNISSISENLIDVNIYPNPSSNIFNLEFNSDSETEISVTNIIGEQVYYESIQSIGDISTKIDLSDYSKGVYNLTIKTSDDISNHKLILQ